METSKPNPFKIVFAILGLLYFGQAILKPHEYLFIYRVDFVFHEAGHLFFGLFGKFIGDLGGTIMQLLLPCLAALYFIKQKQAYSASWILMWIGENWINISIYARDARSRLLPLHGGEAVTHDWSEILLSLHMLHYDKAIGNLFYAFGTLCILSGAAFALYFALRPKICQSTTG